MVGAEHRILRYAVTDLAGTVPGTGPAAAARRQQQWAADLRRWAAQGIDFVQLREKGLDAGEQFALARAGAHLLEAIRGGPPSRRPRLLVNSRADVAAAARADGVHATARPGELTPGQMRTIFRAAGPAAAAVSMSCHTLDEVAAARANAPDLILFGPVFAKQIRGRQVAPGTGLAALREACALAAPVPVLALGGVTTANTGHCLNAGAAGIAGIRLFA